MTTAFGSQGSQSFDRSPKYPPGQGGAPLAPYPRAVFTPVKTTLETRLKKAFPAAAGSKGLPESPKNTMFTSFSEPVLKQNTVQQGVFDRAAVIDQKINTRKQSPLKKGMGIFSRTH